jgi:hypothetical protein
MFPEPCPMVDGGSFRLGPRPDGGWSDGRTTGFGAEVAGEFQISNFRFEIAGVGPG